ncbi:hypothetical protein [Sphingomonas sp. G-3-2-10]|uniref:hypothetical protein n=1 Tax=Sphingomonas sp. G-3-2-10 TaxID=2728838 RepID=UPI00146E3BF7|nr:hypothetical protein [Sphingomonas sp. G-3-2-10]NML04184.1 hypothetical protein [Sphingomonas sp. G-3-2-10]
MRRLFAPRLEALGFTRKGVRYFRPSPPWLMQAIELQQDKYNGSGFCRFTLNLRRMLVPAIRPARMVELALGRKTPFSFDDTNTVRIGDITEIRGDYWYDYLPDDAAGIEATLNEALGDLERYGLLWLRWNLVRVGRGHDRSRAEAAEARFRAYVARLPQADEQP